MRGALTLTLALLMAGRAIAAGASGTLPLQLVPTGDIGGLLVVELRIEGRASRWLVDTGSSRHLVAPALAKQLALAERGRVSADTAFGRFAGPEVTLPPLMLGTLPITQAAAVVLDLRPLAGAAADDIDGVLGAPWLDEVNVAFDFASWTLAASTAPLERCPDGTHEVAVERRRGVPVMSLAVNGAQPERVLFDTGNAAALVRVDSDDAPVRRGVPLPGVSAVLARAARVELGALVRREVPVAHLRAAALRAAMPAEVAALAGVALFEGAQLTLDLGARRACVAPGERVVPGGFGFTIDRQRERLVVTGVLDDSPAHAAGLRAGDAIVSWAGAAAPTSVAAAWSLVRERAELTLDIERGSIARTATLRRSHFLPPLAPLR